jgi:phosphoserine phosphatase
MKVTVVDLCGTLILENTTHGYLRSIPFPLHIALYNRLLQGRLGRIANRVAGRDVSREMLIGALRGWPYKRLAEHAQAYVRSAVKLKVSASVQQELMKARQEGARIYLATCSLEPIAEAVVGAFALDGYVASKLEFDSAYHCTGRISTDVTGIKWRTLCEQFPEIQSAEITVYTDNPEDVDLRGAATFFHYLGPPV